MTSWENINTIEEVGKDEDFRKLLISIIGGLSDAETQEKCEREIILLEKRRGYLVTFVYPKPGYVIEISVDKLKKIFINICASDKVKPPSSQLCHSRDNDWFVPYFQSLPRKTEDPFGEIYIVQDILYNPEALQLAANNNAFRNTLNEAAAGVLEKRFSLKADRINLQFPNLSYKGPLSTFVIRRKALPSTDEADTDLTALHVPYEIYDLQSLMQSEMESVGISACVTSAICKINNQYIVPKYVIKYRSPYEMQNFILDRFSALNATVPNELVLEIDLPLLNSSENLVLDVTGKSLTLVCDEPVKYKLEIALPYHVNEATGTAKFDTSSKKLILVLPVELGHIPSCDMAPEDSGVESESGHQTPEVDCGDNIGINHVVQENEVNNDKECNTVVNSDMKNAFLMQHRQYSLPPSSCNMLGNVITWILHVKNVDPESVDYYVSTVCSFCLHMQFTSVGLHSCLSYYSLCLMLPSSYSVSKENMSIETWDNNVIVQIHLKTCDTPLTEYYIGLNEDNLIKQYPPKPAPFGRLQENLCDTTGEDDDEALKEHLNNDVIELERVSSNSSDEDVAQLEDEHNHGRDVLFEDVITSFEDTDAVPSASIIHPKPRMVEKCRTFSESSGEELAFSPRKSILKSTTRSMSESSMDDYGCSSSFEMISEDDGINRKKSVRFSDVVSHRTFRKNSSILGQRKKNQRKTRNKKRAQVSRRASESEVSDWEMGKVGADEKDEVDNEDETDPIPDEDRVSEISTSMKFGQCSSRIRGKRSKKGRQNSNLLSSEGAQLDLLADLVFDLDIDQ